MNQLRQALDRLSAKEQGRHKIKNGYVWYNWRNKKSKLFRVKDIISYSTYKDTITLTVKHPKRNIDVWELSRDTAGIVNLRDNIAI